MAGWAGTAGSPACGAYCGGGKAGPAWGPPGCAEKPGCAGKPGWAGGPDCGYPGCGGPDCGTGAGGNAGCGNADCGGAGGKPGASGCAGG
ncbi:hypothetical protein FL583_04285 [Cryptosporangium phraense]|uniref:Uncharacterized protein n=1 Tax=Cryptosporangium phraense TaxID=2593070 RepID=A0A545AZ76_9ACTN|nr:hypothetical protein FL583_04285 [Cryptosporangium phraense]